MNLLKSLFSPTTGCGSAAPQPASLGTPVAQPVDPSHRFVWEALSATVGVQLEDYPDVPRRDMQSLFGHAPSRVLDLGCGTGATCLWLKQTYPDAWVWGCEPNPWTAQRAITRVDHLSTDPSDEWTEQEVALLATLDTVLLLDVLEHMFNPWAQLEFLARHLPRDAQVMISLPNAGHVSVLTGLAAGTFKYEKTGILDVTHVRFFTLAEMRGMFEQTGFVIESQAILSYTTVQPEITEFPTQLDFGPMILKVGSEEQWEQMNATQFGFRLRLR